MTPDHLLTDTITVQRYAGRHAEGGDEAFEPDLVEIAAAVEVKIKVVRDARGDDRTSSHWVVTRSQLRERDRVWIPGKDTAREDEALEVVSVSQGKRRVGGALETWESYLGG